MNTELEESLIFCWIRFNSLKHNIIKINQTEKMEKIFNNISFLDRVEKISYLKVFTEKILSLKNSNEDEELDLFFWKISLGENKNLKLPIKVCHFFQNFQLFTQEFFKEKAEMEITQEITKFFYKFQNQDYKICELEKKENLIFFYKILFTINFLQEFSLPKETQNLQIYDMYELYKNDKKKFFKNIMLHPFLFSVCLKIVNSIIDKFNYNSEKLLMLSFNNLSEQLEKFYEENCDGNLSTHAILLTNPNFKTEENLNEKNNFLELEDIFNKRNRTKEFFEGTSEKSLILNESCLKNERSNNKSLKEGFELNKIGEDSDTSYDRYVSYRNNKNFENNFTNENIFLDIQENKINLEKDKNAEIKKDLLNNHSRRSSLSFNDSEKNSNKIKLSNKNSCNQINLSDNSVNSNKSNFSNKKYFTKKKNYGNSENSKNENFKNFSDQEIIEINENDISNDILIDIKNRNLENIFENKNSKQRNSTYKLRPKEIIYKSSGLSYSNTVSNLSPFKTKNNQHLTYNISSENNLEYTKFSKSNTEKILDLKNEINYKIKENLNLNEINKNINTKHDNLFEDFKNLEKKIEELNKFIKEKENKIIFFLQEIMEIKEINKNLSEDNKKFSDQLNVLKENNINTEIIKKQNEKLKKIIHSKNASVINYRIDYSPSENKNSNYENIMQNKSFISLGSRQSIDSDGEDVFIIKENDKSLEDKIKNKFDEDSNYFKEKEIKNLIFSNNSEENKNELIEKYTKNLSRSINRKNSLEFILSDVLEDENNLKKKFTEINKFKNNEKENLIIYPENINQEVLITECENILNGNSENCIPESNITFERINSEFEHIQKNENYSKFIKEKNNFYICKSEKKLIFSNRSNKTDEWHEKIIFEDNSIDNLTKTQKKIIFSYVIENKENFSIENKKMVKKDLLEIFSFEENFILERKFNFEEMEKNIKNDVRRSNFRIKKFKFIEKEIEITKNLDFAYIIEKINKIIELKVEKIPNFNFCGVSSEFKEKFLKCKELLDNKDKILEESKKLQNNFLKSEKNEFFSLLNNSQNINVKNSIILENKKLEDYLKVYKYFFIIFIVSVLIIKIVL